MRIVFLSPELPEAGDPAGARVRSLAGRDGVDVLLALTGARPSAGQDVAWDGARVVAVEDPAVRGADVAIALHWRACAHLFSLGAARTALLVDAFAHERLGTWEADRVPAALAYDLPIDVLAGGDWIVRAFARRRPGVRARLARAAVDGAVFRPAEPAGERAADAPLRVVVDDRWRPDPTVSDAGETLAAHGVLPLPLPPGASPAERAEVLRGADVLLLLDPAGGDGAVVREAMACGAVPVVLPAGGQADPVVDDENGLVVEPDDHRGTARRLERLAGDPALLARLRAGALEAAAAWPDEAAASDELQASLTELVAEPMPVDAAWPARLMGDAIAQSAILSNEIHTLGAALRSVENGDAFKTGTKVMETWHSPRLARVRRLAAPVARRMRPRLDGGGAGPTP